MFWLCILGFFVVLFIFPQFILFLAAFVVALILILAAANGHFGVEPIFWTTTLPVFLLIVGVAWVLVMARRRA